MIWRITMLSVLALQVAHAQASETAPLCETRTATIPVPEYQHCEKGDLVQLEEHEVARLCALSEPVVVLGERVLCTYRGEKRQVRSRPLSDIEKAYDKDQVDELVDQYSD